ncbi:tetratricopeptide (TPR) repeat protein [Spinactinospora alkalitolerans]|uniref:Tetratricopeptide (TPR) repeat protein n=1 Tax=Spinactinospora alkalitolerans TaxID=687207 RepID=A0A852TXM3_9ACTN|nr:tetratricopeptide repeat protein [Spinactinospora alkalitolerans]NYE46784.1 tetratricopeptide (TPR) repeat protein [Spinactinospora alkalitolerans]
MELARLARLIGQTGVAVLLGAALWSAGRPFMGIAVLLLVGVVIPVAAWWLFERQGPAPTGAGLDRQILRDELGLAHHEDLLGPAHPQTLTARNNLAFDYALAGRLDEAIVHYETALTFAIHVEGPDHPETLIVRRNLADAYRRSGRRAEAAAQMRLADRTGGSPAMTP